MSVESCLLLIWLSKIYTIKTEIRYKYLILAQQVVSGKDDIKQAMEFLKECDLIRIEDILPFFSDFVTIDHFRESICNSLKVRTECYFNPYSYYFGDFNAGIQPTDTRSQRRNGRCHTISRISTGGYSII